MSNIKEPRDVVRWQALILCRILTDQVVPKTVEFDTEKVVTRIVTDVMRPYKQKTFGPKLRLKIITTAVFRLNEYLNRELQ